MTELQAVVPHEVDYQMKLWQADFEEALSDAEQGPGWSEFRGTSRIQGPVALSRRSAAWLGDKAGAAGMDARSRTQFVKAKAAATGIPWLVGLARFQENGTEVPIAPADELMEQLEKVEVILAHLGTVHDRAFAKREKEILDGLNSKTALSLNRHIVHWEKC